MTQTGRPAILEDVLDGLFFIAKADQLAEKKEQEILG